MDPADELRLARSLPNLVERPDLHPTLATLEQAYGSLTGTDVMPPGPFGGRHYSNYPDHWDMTCARLAPPIPASVVTHIAKNSKR